MAFPHAFRRSFRLALVLSLSASVCAYAAVPEYTAKALIVSHLIPFVRWPVALSGAPFRVGVLGSNPFDGALEEILRGDDASGRPIIVVRAMSAEGLRDCDVVVISADAREALPHVLEILEAKPVLTISDTPGFAANGGMVGLALTAQHKLRLEVNLAAVRASGLQISAQVLRVAAIVKGGPQ